MGNNNPQATKNALCYIPIMAFIIYFVEQNKSVELEKHVRYWMILLGVYVILSIFLWWLLSWLIFLAYIWLSAYLWYKVFSGEDVKIEIIDNFFDKK